MAKVVLVEDDLMFSQLLEGFLKKQGHEVVVTHRAKEGIRILEAQSPDLALIDYRLPDGDGMEVLQAARSLTPAVPAVIMTSFHDIRTAVKAMRSGAFDYITKPVNPDELLLVIRDALSRRNALPSEEKQEQETGEFIEGESEISRKLHEHIRLVAPTELSVIIQGESGTGKEYVARSIHRLSRRAGAPFVALDCGALSDNLAGSELFGHAKGAFTGALQDKKGQFELASGGTLFLDEIGNLSYDVQVKLLRAIQERVVQPLGSNRSIQVDVRLIAATNEDLLQSVKSGAFREDLYHRLNEFRIAVPPLRRREGDRKLFTRHFIGLANKELGKQVKDVSPEVEALFARYEWPGNLRELRNTVRRAVLLAQGEVAGKETLPEEMFLSLHTSVQPVTPDLKAMQEINERELIVKTLQEVKFNKTKAARLLNIDRKTLYHKMARYGIEG